MNYASLNLNLETEKLYIYIYIYIYIHIHIYTSIYMQHQQEGSPNERLRRTKQRDICNIHDAIVEVKKALVPYFEVLHLRFIKRPCDAKLVFCSCLLDARMKTCEKTEGTLLKKCLQMNKQLHNAIRSENIIIFNFAKVANVWASY